MGSVVLVPIPILGPLQVTEGPLTNDFGVGPSRT